MNKMVRTMLVTAIVCMLSAMLPIYAQRALTEQDYREVAAELGIDVAAIKALASIEGGGHGFDAQGRVTVNFDLSVFKRFIRKAGISEASARKTAPVAFAAVNSKRYGGYVAAQQARLDDACKVDRRIALEATFWGLFQIGGFCYKMCGCKDVEEYVRLNKESERAQLELFARFLTNAGYVKYVKSHNWRAFARAYNGGRQVSSYAAKLQRAYNKFKK